MAKTLELIFVTVTGESTSITLDSPKEPVNSVEVKQAMDAIVASNAFYSSKGELVGSKAARVVERNVTLYEL